MARPPVLLAVLGTVAVAFAQAPSGYYASIDASSAAALRSTLHALIDDHVEFPYTSSATDTWDVLELAQEDLANGSRIVDIYRNASYPKYGGGNTDYNREHSWPKSYGFPTLANHGPYTDCHALFLCNDSYNSARLNNPFGTCTPACIEYPTDPTNGIGGGSGLFPGNSNWRSSTSGPYGTWQVWRERRGDVARALLYLDVRYEGGVHGGTSRTEPDLVLTDSRSLIVASQTGSDLPVAYMGLLAELLQWHLDDPPDAWELARNDAVFAFQQNRNPFVDHPEWVAVLWGLSVPGSVTQLGTGCAGAIGATPTIAVGGVPTIGRTTVVSVFSAPPFETAALHLDHGSTSIDLGVLGFTGCTLYVVPLVSAVASTSLFGTAQIAIPIPNHPNLVGQHLFGQWLVVDSAEAGIVATPAVDMQVGS